MATKNTIREGVPFSPDLLPAGPDPSYDYRPRINQNDTSGYVTQDWEPQDSTGDLYDGLPDISVPKHSPDS